MSLPQPSPQYDPGNEAQTRAEIDAMDQQNYKKGQDIEITSAQRLIMADDDGTRGVLSIIAGVPTWTAL